MANREQQNNNHRYDALWQEIEQGDHEQLDRKQFEQMAERMERFTVADPTEQQTQDLIAKLTPLLEKPWQEEVSKHHVYDQQNIGHAQNSRSIWSRLVSLLLQQVPVFSWMFWVISVVIISVGAVMMPFMREQFINPFLMLIPLVSGFGVFYALRAYRTPMGELEASLPVSPAEIMIGRIGVVLIYNIGFALVASIGLFAFSLTDSLFLFIISWLVPLCLCTVLTLVCMLRLGALAGPTLSIAVWGVQLLMREWLGPFYFMSDLNDPFWELSRLIGSVLTVLLLASVIQHLHQKNKGAFSDADSA